ncbi:hypothetical protein [Mesorhizobium muleiense]|uniref:hypothetical protein n=1 Tax=Mesorhizobium muleiense TaxID=1004279 RepID=UPI001F249BAF|nr:hypothetical protein [Mesorhizobium muleiense]MCF6110811.1 hypothetical protein [Mesorhizobium muleiense]
MKRYAVCLLGIFFWCPAHAYTQAQENVLNKLAEAYAVNTLCHDLAINKKLVMQVLVLSRLGTVEAAQELVARAAVKVQENRHHKQEVICATGLLLFGPSGLNAANILIRE